MRRESRKRRVIGQDGTVKKKKKKKKMKKKMKKTLVEKNVISFSSRWKLDKDKWSPVHI